MPNAFNSDILEKKIPDSVLKLKTSRMSTYLCCSLISSLVEILLKEQCAQDLTKKTFRSQQMINV